MAAGVFGNSAIKHRPKVRSIFQANPHERRESRAVAIIQSRLARRSINKVNALENVCARNPVAFALTALFAMLAGIYRGTARSRDVH
jgi:hypothetical protein